LIDPKVITLLTLLEAGSYTNAAKILSLTQPAVSRHIQLLEEEYRQDGIYVKAYVPKDLSESL